MDLTVLQIHEVDGAVDIIALIPIGGEHGPAAVGGSLFEEGLGQREPSPFVVGAAQGADIASHTERPGCARG